MRVSVIIVTWNGRALLERCLPSVLATEFDGLEVVVADNASTDDTLAWLAATHPEVRVIAHPENWLFARGNNEAIRQTALDTAPSDYVCLLNNDVEVPPGWLTPLVHVLDTMPDVAAVQPKLLQHGDRTRFEYAGASGGFLDAVGYPFTRGRLFDTLEPDTGQYDDARDVFWASGAALLLRRSALDEVGLLDEAFGMHMEEIDLCWRLWRAGWRVRVEPSAEVYHIGGASLPQGDPRKAYLNFRNSLLMLFKNLPPRAWLATFPRRLALDTLAATRALTAGRPREAAAIARAYLDAHRMRGTYLDRRPASSPVTLPYRGSIALDYFLRKRQRFADLPAERFSPLLLPAPEETAAR
ncbi:MAG: glycosyltransferase family 2 protein [Bacteroidota bacterium]